MRRTLIALGRLETSGQEITFRSVAAEARVSTAWLYSEPELRGRISRLRKSQDWKAPAVPNKASLEGLSKKSIIATLRLRIKKLEEENRELTDRLEQTYGLIAITNLSDTRL